MKLSFACALSAFKRAAALGLAAAVLAGCASRPGPDSLEISLEEAEGTKDVHILVATTRARAEHPPALYTSKRSEELDFASATISIPPTHKPGRIEWASSPPGNPNTDFVVRQAAYIDGNAAFRQQVNQAIAKRAGREREAVLFIHATTPAFLRACSALRRWQPMPRSTVCRSCSPGRPLAT
ncbi:hypothetical protein [Pseudovibrio denitrificans]|uniref:hypothetical protein n=1 Tax=Pseudovibrio denitrificans TaxID=258256 RepID=UPI000B01BA54|nr:hypothetical protein [Pseudovibrio denitrificans]